MLIMKKWTLLLACSIAVKPLAAQLPREIFRQNATQLHYMKRQLELLGSSAVLIREGYEISIKGLDTIRERETGSYGLNLDYDQRLSRAGAAVLHDAHARALVGLETAALQRQERCRKLLENRPRDDWLREYAAGIFGQLHTGTLNRLHSLEELTGDGNLRMTTARRLRRLDALYLQAEDAYSFCGYFLEEVTLLVDRDARVGKDSRAMKALYEKP
jgi:hypothetical protein